MNTLHATTTISVTPSVRIKGAGLAAMLTLAMLLGINTLAAVAPAEALMASAAHHGTAAPAARI